MGAKSSVATERRPSAPRGKRRSFSVGRKGTESQSAWVPPSPEDVTETLMGFASQIEFDPGHPNLIMVEIPFPLFRRGDQNRAHPRGVMQPHAS